MRRAKVRPSAKGQVWQFTRDTAGELRSLVLPTGQVTVQVAASETIPNRCYVPTLHGTVILDEGGYIVQLASGTVLALTAEQYDEMFVDAADEALFTLAAKKPPEAQAVLFSSDAFTFLEAERLRGLIDTEGLDWVTHVSGVNADKVELVLNSTGRRLGKWKLGDAVHISTSGHVTVGNAR